MPIWARLPPALQLRCMKHRALACRWHLGVFPVHYRYLSAIGLHMYLDDLRSLSQKKVKNLELRKIRIALTVSSSITELECLPAIRKRTRKVLLDKMKKAMVLGKGLCLALRLPNSKYRRLAIRWHLCTFPIHYRFLRRNGLQRLLDHMNFLSEKKLEPQEQISLRIALDTISCNPDVPPFV